MELVTASVDSWSVVLTSFVVALAVDRVERAVGGAAFFSVSFPFVVFLLVIVVVGWEGASFCSHRLLWGSYVLLSLLVPKNYFPIFSEITNLASRHRCLQQIRAQDVVESLFPEVF